MTFKQVKVIKPGMNQQIPHKVIVMQSLKDLASTVSKKTANIKFSVKSGTVPISPLLNMWKIKNIGIPNNTDLADIIDNHTKFQLN